MIGIFLKKERSCLNKKRESDILEIKKLVKNLSFAYTMGKSCSYYKKSLEGIFHFFMKIALPSFQNVIIFA